MRPGRVRPHVPSRVRSPWYGTCVAIDDAHSAPPHLRLVPRSEAADSVVVRLPRQRPPTADAWYERACDLEDDARDDAVAAYRRALEIDPSHAAARINLGRLLHASGDVAGAQAEYLRAVAAAPLDPIAWFNLGVALEDGDQPASALAAYDRALEIDPDLLDAHDNAGRLCRRLGRDEEALRHLSACHRARRR